MSDPKLHCVVAEDASQWSLIGANIRACEKQVGDIGDDQCLGLWGDSGVYSREKVESGVRGEGSTAVMEVEEKCVAVVAIWAGLCRCGCHIKLHVPPAVTSSTAAGK